MENIRKISALRSTLTLLLTLLVSGIVAQNKNTVFYDSVGQLTSYENHWSQVFTGRYKSIYNKKENTKTLIRATDKEFQTELAKTEKRIFITDKLGTDFPNFEVIDVDGNRLVMSELKGKIVVINLWFVGCVPCEAERPVLNSLVKLYSNNEDVVFIAFAKNTKEQLAGFLKDHPFIYRIVPTDKDYIKSKFETNAYPINIIIDKEGKYFFNSEASGIGIMTILQRQIDKALKE